MKTTIDYNRNLEKKLALMKKDPVVLKIVKAVCDQHLVSLEEMRTPNRKHYVRYPRYLCIGLIREHTKHSLTVIGLYFNRIHATVIHALNMLKSDIKYNQEIREDYERLEDMLISTKQRETRRNILKQVLDLYVTDEVLKNKWLNKYVIAD